MCVIVIVAWLTRRGLCARDDDGRPAAHRGRLLPNGETTTGGLRPIAGAHCPTELGVPASQCAGFAIGASDGVLYNASAAVGAAGDTLVLTATASSGAARVLNTSFGYSNYPVALFENGLGLPLAPWTPQPVQATDGSTV